MIIPNGSYSWSGTLSISKAVTLAGQSPAGVTINNSLASGAVIFATAYIPADSSLSTLTKEQTKLICVAYI